MRWLGRPTGPMTLVVAGIGAKNTPHHTGYSYAVTSPGLLARPGSLQALYFALSATTSPIVI
jgi:hypothetical protein